jgi:hypothetical protein
VSPVIDTMPALITNRRVAFWPSSATVCPFASMLTDALIVIAEVKTMSGQSTPKTTEPPAAIAVLSALCVHDRTVLIAAACAATTPVATTVTSPAAPSAASMRLPDLPNQPTPRD